ncbi:hypothetical protein LWI29_032533 [Acer saccharum]|uniref:Uncharacterized protein n=1 Tax=Acer saccharum TaxID=4024 RepID=A0AA39T591_ACESA|nr:hypothetical protein LWI29_032533 [Acer saccharum]
MGSNSSVESSKEEMPFKDNKELSVKSERYWEDNEGVFNESKMRNDKVFCLAAKGHGMKSRSSKYKLSVLDPEEEITKIIDLGSALGFDFDDKEVRMSDVIVFFFCFAWVGSALFVVAGYSVWLVF